MTYNILNLSKTQLIGQLWKSEPHLHSLLRHSKNMHEARDSLFDYINALERHYFNIYSDKHYKHMHIIEKNEAKECIRVLKNIIRTENEKIAGFSALQHLISLAKYPHDAANKVSEGFICEFIFLFRGIHGIISNKFGYMEDSREKELFRKTRSKQLDIYANIMRKYLHKYKTGLEAEIKKKRLALKEKILRETGGTKSDWLDYKWHLKNVVKDADMLSSIVKLEKDEKKGLRLAEEFKIPFNITPYYLSLFNMHGRCEFDRAIRAQVIPGPNYCNGIMKNRQTRQCMDFMGEGWTSPIETITRRYPGIVILKPFDACPQICVYCQRNWEIKDIHSGTISLNKIKKALEWIENNQSISEILITGGDPLTMKNKTIEWLLEKAGKISHIERIRIGTRTLVTLPYRIDKGFLDILEQSYIPGKRDISIITHFEHSSEITPDCIEAASKIRKKEISIYNQQVFTYYNSRRFETCKLRKTLKLCGIDPYYCFNTKGKEETADFRVPIPRIEQERKEEARLLSGIVRTDEPVFNVPMLGKSHLRAWQEHEPISILANGSRVYRFFPWESKIAVADAYIYADVPIYDYLKRLQREGENPEEYMSIWYYF